MTQVALITGASRRIGRQMAHSLHDSGREVIIHCYKNVEEANQLCERLNQLRSNSALTLSADLRSLTQCQQLIEQAINWHGGLDILINNASAFFTSDLNENQEENWQTLFDTNVKAPFFLSQYAKETLNKRQGQIINITDIHAERALKNHTIYCMTKAALKMQTESMAKELAPNVRVNAVAPGAIAWPEGRQTLTSEQQASIIERTLLKRHGNCEAIAKAVISLVDNDFITGETIHVDGGRRLN